MSRTLKQRDSGRSRKRQEWEISRDRSIIAELKYKGGGLSDQAIADHLNAREDIEYTLTKRMIGYERESILETWREGQGDADVWVDEEMMRLYGVEHSAWNAWEESLKPKEKERILERTSNKGNTSEIETFVENQIGNPAYLKIILDCVDRRSKLRGLYISKLHIKAETEHLIKTYHVISPGDWDALPSGNDPQIIDGEISE